MNCELTSVEKLEIYMCIHLNYIKGRRQMGKVMMVMKEQALVE